jgi:predicted flap endonuclease-1-like 5' DNA nuclease
MVDWKQTGILAQLRDLDRQRQRLELLLGPDPEWQAYQAAGSAAPSADLKANALFKARDGLIGAREALQELLGEVADHPPYTVGVEQLPASPAVQPAAPSDDAPEQATTDAIDDAPVGDAFRTRLNVKPRPPAADGERPPAHAAGRDSSPEAPGPLERRTDQPDVAPVRVPVASGLLAFLALPRRPAVTGPSGQPDSVDSAPEPLTAPEPSEPPAPTGLDSPANDDEPGRLDQIRGMEAKYVSALLANGVKTCRDIAAWAATDVARFKFLLGPGARITKDQWIEQAAVLAHGVPTRYARLQAAGYLGAISATPPDRTPWVPHRYQAAAVEEAAAAIPRVAPEPGPPVETAIPTAASLHERAEARKVETAAEHALEAAVQIVRTTPVAAQSVATQTARSFAPTEPGLPAIDLPVAEPAPPSPQRYDTAAQEASVEIIRPRPRKEPERPPPPAHVPDIAVTPANVDKTNPISRFLRALTGD